MAEHKISDDIGDQFRAEMMMQDNPWCVAFSSGWMAGEQIVVITQQNNNIAFCDPPMLRGIAKMLMDAAHEWESGRLEFPKPNPKKGS